MQLILRVVIAEFKTFKLARLHNIAIMVRIHECHVLGLLLSQVKCYCKGRSQIVFKEFYLRIGGLCWKSCRVYFIYIVAAIHIEVISQGVVLIVVKERYLSETLGQGIIFKLCIDLTLVPYIERGRGNTIGCHSSLLIHS